MLDIMYELPSMENIRECVITEEVIRRKGQPIWLYHPLNSMLDRTSSDEQDLGCPKAFWYNYRSVCL
jgi:hypothetical protein